MGGIYSPLGRKFPPRILLAIDESNTPRFPLLPRPANVLLTSVRTPRVRSVIPSQATGFSRQTPLLLNLTGRSIFTGDKYEYATREPIAPMHPMWRVLPGMVARKRETSAQWWLSRRNVQEVWERRIRASHAFVQVNCGVVGWGVGSDCSTETFCRNHRPNHQLAVRHLLSRPETAHRSQ